MREVPGRGRPGPDSVVRILHFHKGIRLEHGGVVRAVLDFCEGLARHGQEVVLATGDDADVPEAWKRGDAGLPSVLAVPAPSRLGRLNAPAKAALEAAIRDADVVHLHGVWGPYNTQIAAIARRLETPSVHSVHGMLDDWCMAQRTLKKRIYLALGGRAVLERAAAVHCTAEAELAQAKKWFPRGRGVVVPLIMDLSDYAELPGPGPARARFPELADGRPTLLFLSRLHYKKGVEHLIDATGLLAERGSDVRTIVAGTGDDAYEALLRRRIAERGLEERVTLAGFVSGVEKVSLYEACDVFVLPTSQENFGFVLFEALAARTPVVTTKGTDTWPEMEASGGSLVVAQDAAAIADAAQALLEDAERRRTMGEAGREWVLEHLGAGAVVESYVQLYEAAVRGNVEERAA